MSEAQLVVKIILGEPREPKDKAAKIVGREANRHRDAGDRALDEDAFARNDDEAFEAVGARIARFHSSRARDIQRHRHFASERFENETAGERMAAGALPRG
jgi:hypothetical protein